MWLKVEEIHPGMTVIIAGDPYKIVRKEEDTYTEGLRVKLFFQRKGNQGILDHFNCVFGQEMKVQDNAAL